MKNNKGFTTIELVVSFALIAVMMLLLFELVLYIKGLYLTSGIKTELLTKQGLMSTKLNDDLMNNEVTELTNCGVDCLDITYNGTVTKRLIIDSVNGIYRYDSYATNLIHDSKFGVPTVIFDVVYDAEANEYDSYFMIKVPISHKLYNGEDFGVIAVYQFDSRVTPLEFADFR